MNHLPVRYILRFLSALMLCLALPILAGCGKQASSSVHTVSPAVSAAIAASAKSQIGKPYCRGGISPSSGFDCSGLVYWACRQNSVNVPRVSKEQAQTGQKVTRGELRPGDIVVFKTSWAGYHTGIYLGQNRFIHSPKPRSRVRIDSLEHEYWSKHFVTARRVVHH